MKDRLAEIERHVDRCARKWGDDDTDIVNQRWLIARVRALEAQAALDATVVEAIGPYREADSAVTRAYNRYVASNGTSEEAVAEFDLNWTRGVFVGYERVLDDALDAALAARNGE